MLLVVVVPSTSVIAPRLFLPFPSSVISPFPFMEVNTLPSPTPPNAPATQPDSRQRPVCGTILKLRPTSMKLLPREVGLVVVVVVVAAAVVVAAVVVVAVGER